MKEFLIRHKYVQVLLLVAVAAYFWTLWYAPIYDFADEYFPGRYFMLEAIRNGIFPLWSPYQSMGLPIHGDPQAAVFYLPLWIMSLFGPYSSFTWGIEYIFHAFMGGWGFYLLARVFVKNDKAAFITACCYMLSGFYVANMAQISWTIAAAWSPWLIRSMIAVFEKPGLRNALFLALFASLLFTGGYTGFSFIQFTLFLILLIYYTIRNIKQKHYLYFKKLIPPLLLAGVICLLMALPGFLSYYEVKDYITRGEVLSYEKSAGIPFTPQSLLSLLFPLVSCSEGDFTGTDISMGSIYVGALTLLFFGLGLSGKKRGVIKVLLYWGLACFLISFGHYLPFHKWAYYLIPFIKMLRFPAIFRLFVILSLLLAAALGLDKVIGDVARYRKQILLFSGVLAVLLMGFGIILMISGPGIFRDLYTANVYNMMHASIRHKFVFEALFQCALLGVVFLLGWTNRKYSLNGILIILVFDLVFNAWICMRRTGIMSDFTNIRLSEMLDKQPRGYPTPTEVTSSTAISHEKNITHFWRNLGVYTKQIEWDSYGPFVLNSHSQMLRPYYDNDEILKLDAAVFYPEEVVYSEKAVFFNIDTVYTNQRESVYSSSGEEPLVHIDTFQPGYMVFRTTTAHSRPLVIGQNYYKGWRAQTGKGEELPITTLSTSLMSIRVPEGETIIRFRYDRHDLKYAFGIQLFFVLLSAGLLIYDGSKRKQKKAREEQVT